jgi:hypothetical protein
MGAIIAIEMSATKFDTVRLKNKPPRDFAGSIPAGCHRLSYRKCDPGGIPEQELGRVRHTIHDFFQPDCYDNNGTRIWSYQGHSQHKKCLPRRSLVFILSDKHAVLENLRSLGCDVEKL